MKKTALFVLLMACLVLFSCSPLTPDIGSLPSTPAFTAIPTANPNYIVFTAKSTDGFLCNWDFGNGTSSTKQVDTAYYPFPDKYVVKLTVSNKGGATTAIDTLVISTLDSAIANNRNYNLLTGGIGSVNGKKWAWLNGDGAMSNGEYIEGFTDPLDTSWWQSVKGNLDPLALDDEYVFTLKNYKYENNCNGFFQYNWMWALELLGKEMGQWKDSSFAYTPPTPSTWTLTEDVNVTTVDTVIIDTALIFDSTVIIDTVIIDTFVIDTVITDSTVIHDTIIIDTIIIDTVIIDTIINDTTIFTDTLILDTIIIDTVITNDIIIDTTVIDTNVIIDTIIIDTTVTIDTTIINTVTNDTLLILELSNSNYMGMCAGTSIYQIMYLVEDTMQVRYKLFNPVKGEIEEWYHIKFVAVK